MIGIDISNYQANLDLSKVKPDFVIIKATEGTDYVSPSGDKQYQAAKSLGIPRGVYHFARNSRNTAQAEADYFVSQIKGYVGDALLVLDWEDPNGNLKDTAWAKTWLDRVCALTGVKPLIYMSASVCRGADWSQVVAGDYGLWVAAYGANNGQQNTKPSIKYWPSYALWQYTSVGRLAGYSGNLDLNEFYGDRAAWAKYAGKNTNSDTPGGIQNSSGASENESEDAMYNQFLDVDNFETGQRKLVEHLGINGQRCGWGDASGNNTGGFLGSERRENKMLAAQVVDLKNKLETESRLNSDYCDEILGVREKYETAYQEVLNLQKQINQFDQTLVEKNKTIDALQAQVTALKARLTSGGADAGAETDNSEVGNLQQTIATLNVELRQLQDHCSALETQLKALQARSLWEIIGDWLRGRVG